MLIMSLTLKSQESVRQHASPDPDAADAAVEPFEQSEHRAEGQDVVHRFQLPVHAATGSGQKRIDICLIHFYS